MTRKFRYTGKGHTMITDIKWNPLQVNENEIIESELDMDFLLANGFELIWAKDVKDLKSQLKTLVASKKELAPLLKEALEVTEERHAEEIEAIKLSFDKKAEAIKNEEDILNPQIKQAKADTELAKKNIQVQMEELQSELGEVEVEAKATKKSDSDELIALRAEGKKLKIKWAHNMWEAKLIAKIKELKE